MVWKDGTVFKGDYRNGKANGHGVLVKTSGGIYDGRFVDDEADGTGVFTHGSYTYKG